MNLLTTITSYIFSLDAWNVLYLCLIFPGSSLIVFTTLFLLHCARGEGYLFSKAISYKKNLYYFFIRPIVSIGFGVLLFFILQHFNVIRVVVFQDNYFFQAVVLFFSFEFLLFFFHMSTHDIKLFSFMHKQHHALKKLYFTNSVEESLLFELVIVGLYVLCFYIISAPLSVVALVIVFWKTLLAVTHHHVPFSYGILDYVFASPFLHHDHHKKVGVFYGLTTSLFDHIYRTTSKHSRSEDTLSK